MKNNVMEAEGNVILECGEYHFTYCNVTIQEMLDDWSWRDFLGCSSDEDGSVCLDITENDAYELLQALETKRAKARKD